MRAQQVVAVAKDIELALAVLQAGEVEVAQHFERAMEAFVLALGLGMVRASVAYSDAESDQPQAKDGERRVAVGAPPASRCPSASRPAAITAKGAR